MSKFFKKLFHKITNPFFGTDPFGTPILLKRFMISTLGMLTYGRFRVTNNLKIEGTEYLEKLPNHNVLFLSNHQTYFADVMAFYHIFSGVKWKFRNNIKLPVYLLAPRVKTYYVAASETMKSGLIPRLFTLGGAVTVERSWRAEGKNVKRELDTSAEDKIGKALSHGWVISFPQGTTSPYAPIRKGTGHLIKKYNPIVVPVEIDGFRRAFDKKGLFFKKVDANLRVTFKEPLTFAPDATVEEIVAAVEKAIGQKLPEGDWAKPIHDKREEQERKRLEKAQALKEQEKQQEQGDASEQPKVGE